MRRPAVYYTALFFRVTLRTRALGGHILTFDGKYPNVFCGEAVIAFEESEG